jgi:hypothetical protein
MVRIAVCQAAFEAVAAMLLGRVVYEPGLNAKGERLALNKLDALRALSESYSDVILRLVEREA